MPRRPQVSVLALAILERLEELAQLEPAAMDPALGGGKADVERGSDLLVRETRQIAKNHRFPVLERKLRQGGEDSSAKIVRLRRRLRKGIAPRVSGSFTLERVEVGQCVLFATRTGQCCVDADAVEPREQRGVASVAIEVPPRLHERVLYRFLYVARVVEDAEQHDAQPMLVPPHDLRERVEIPLLRQSHELGIGLLAGRHPGIVRF